MSDPTSLDLPDEICEEYQDAVFKDGPDCPRAQELREKYGKDLKWGPLFLEFADSTDQLKRAVGS